jgi:NADH:ubiquinone oxidoreductase subunit 5 (subunit L)/multisubunit Na+/H+ antiporter MnhA subunit
LLHTWLAPVFQKSIEFSGRTEVPYNFLGIDGVLAIITTTLVACAIGFAWRLFGVNIRWFGIKAEPRPDRVRSLAALPLLAPLYKGSSNKWWFDEINNQLFVVWGGKLAAAAFWFDRRVIDGTVNGIGAVTTDAGARLRQIQTGRVQNYALGIAIGLIGMTVLYILIAVR